MQIKFNFNRPNYARVCHSMAGNQRHTPSTLTAVDGDALSNNDVISYHSLRFLRQLRYVSYVPYFACVTLAGPLETPLYS